MNILKRISICCILFATNTAFALSDEQKEFLSMGEDLHDESCLACHIATHDTAFYTRNDAKVKDLFTLRSQVSRCSGFFETSWFPDEEASVVEYLNHTYYALQK